MTPDPRWQTVRDAFKVLGPAPVALDALDSLEAERSAGLAFERYRAEKAEAEVERLQGRLKASGIIALMRRAEKAEDEASELREALESGEWADLSGGNSREVLMIDAKIARAALGGEEKP